jgi:hypothetical protein
MEEKKYVIPDGLRLTFFEILAGKDRTWILSPIDKRSKGELEEKLFGPNADACSSLAVQLTVLFVQWARQNSKSDSFWNDRDVDIVQNFLKAFYH